MRPTLSRARIVILDMNSRARSVFGELDGSLPASPTRRYPPGRRSGRRSPVRGIWPRVPSAETLAQRYGGSEMSKRVADVLVETLQAAGVKTCYGIVGDTLN